MIPVGELDPAGCWDSNMLHQLFDNELYPTGLEFKRCEGYPNARTAGCILVIPGRYWAHHTHQINEAVQHYKWLLAIRTGDEEDWLDPAAIEHPNIKWWIQSPRTDVDYGDARLFGVGYPPHFNNLPQKPPERSTEVFLSGQNTHHRRYECFQWLKDVPNSDVRETGAFTDGMPPAAYAHAMSSACVAPAPAGPATPDTFRLYEALEAHTIPIADDITPAYDSAGYWRTVHPDARFPILTNYAHLPAYISDMLHQYPFHANRVTAWWIAYKRRMAHWLREDLQALGAL